MDNILNEIIDKIKAVADDELYKREDAWFRAGIDEGLERAVKIITEYIND